MKKFTTVAKFTKNSMTSSLAKLVKIHWEFYPLLFVLSAVRRWARYLSLVHINAEEADF